MKQVELPKEETKVADPAAVERQRLLQLIFSEKDDMLLEYTTLIKHTGSLVTNSMGYAYSKAINDIIKLISKEGQTDEKPVQEG